LRNTPTTTRLTQGALIGIFLVFMFSVAIVQTAIDVSSGRTPQFLDLFRRPPTEANLREYEAVLEEVSCELAPIFRQLAGQIKM